MKTLARFFNLADAELLKTRLEAQDIPVFLAEEASFTAGYGQIACALRLQVAEKDLEHARQVLAEVPTLKLPDDFELAEENVPVVESPRETPLLPLVIGLVVIAVLMLFLVKQSDLPRRPDDGSIRAVHKWRR